jgi:hypothetical protein
MVKPRNQIATNHPTIHAKTPAVRRLTTSPGNLLSTSASVPCAAFPPPRPVRSKTGRNWGQREGIGVKREGIGVNSSLLTTSWGHAIRGYGETSSAAISGCCLSCDLPG